MEKKKTLCILIAGILAILFHVNGAPMAWADSGQAQKPVYEKLDLAMTINGTDIATDTKVANYFAESMYQATDGRVVVNVFANDQLAGGNATKGIEMVSVGAVDLAAYASSTLSVLDERLSIATIPWVFDNYQQARKVIDATGGGYYAKVLKEQGLLYLGSAHNGFRQVTNSKKAIRTPDDVRGLKIRVPGGEVYIKFFKAFGADPVAMSWSETFTAIQQGTIDGQENGFSVTNSAKIYEIQKYMSIWNYTYENYIFVANEKVFHSFSPQVQELIKEKMAEACEWGRDLVEEEQEELKYKFNALGMEVLELTSDELDKFKPYVSELVEYLKNKYGPEACEAFGI